MLNTVAEFKRLMVRGLRLELIGYTVNMLPKPHPNIGRVRCVVHVQTNEVCLADSMDAPRSNWGWMSWPKKGELFWEEGAREFGVQKGTSRLTYKILPEPSNG